MFIPGLSFRDYDWLQGVIDINIRRQYYHSENNNTLEGVYKQSRWLIFDEAPAIVYNIYRTI